MRLSAFGLLHFEEPIKKRMSNGASPLKMHMAVVLAGNKNDFCMGNEIAKNIMIHYLSIATFLNTGFILTSAIRSRSIDNFE